MSGCLLSGFKCYFVFDSRMYVYVCVGKTDPSITLNINYPLLNKEYMLDIVATLIGRKDPSFSFACLRLSHLAIAIVRKFQDMGRKKNAHKVLLHWNWQLLQFSAPCQRDLKFWNFLCGHFYFFLFINSIKDDSWLLASCLLQLRTWISNQIIHRTLCFCFQFLRRNERGCFFGYCFVLFFLTLAIRIKILKVYNKTDFPIS